MAYRSWSDGDGQQVAGWVRSEMKDVFSGASILLVEDDDDVEGYEVICKPFDLDDLVTRVKRRLDSGPRRQRPMSSLPSKRSGDHGDSDCPDPVELILYVNVDSPESAGAIDNIKRVLARFGSARVKLTICDLSRNPDAGAADSVPFTATLTKRSSGPRTFILGHITNPDVLVEILQDCGAAGV